MSWTDGKEATIIVDGTNGSTHTIDARSWDMCFNGTLLQVMDMEGEIQSFPVFNMRKFRVKPKKK